MSSGDHGCFKRSTREKGPVTGDNEQQQQQQQRRRRRRQQQQQQQQQQCFLVLGFCMMCEGKLGNNIYFKVEA
jgi:hypothetical protein